MLRLLIIIGLHGRRHIIREKRILEILSVLDV